MKVVPPEPAVNLYTEGFEQQDILQRKKTGDALSDLLNRIDDPLVVALDGRWGTGKTYFLKRWVGEHQNATTIYFDAFAHDYISDPLPALVSVLADRTPVDDKDKLNKLKKAAFQLTRFGLRAGLAAATYGATEVMSGPGDAVAKTLSSEADSAFQKYWAREKDRRDAMEDFKEAIKAIARPADVGHNGVVFVIDELDRCRPDYALEVLEVIKHLFTVPHLHFVLGVNLTALEDMVRSKYGPTIEAHRYLGKFIQVKLELPDEFDDDSNRKTTMLAYLDHLVRQMEIPDRISDPMRKQIEIVGRANHFSLRDIGSIVSSVSLASDEVVRNPNNTTFLQGWIEVMNTLIISRIVRPDLHPKFLDAAVTPEDLKSYLGTNREELTPPPPPDPLPAPGTRGTNEEKLTPPTSGYMGDLKKNVLELYFTWLFLSQDEEYKKYELTFNYILERLDKFRFARYDARESAEAARSVPKRVNRIWLDRFSFYTPSQS